MLAVLRDRNFALLWAGQFISMVGDWVLVAALPVYVYETTGSALATGAMFMVQLLPRLLLGTVAGALIDRWDPRRTMIIGDLSRAVVLLALLLVPALGWVWVVYLVGFCESVLAQFFFPAERALIPRVVGLDRVGEANSLYGVGANLARIIGPALGGAAMAMASLPTVVLLDAASYLISGLMISLIALEAAPARAAGTPTGAGPGAMLTAVWRDWLEGLRLIRGDRMLVGLFVVLGIAMLADAMVSPLFVVYVEELLGGGAEEMGWLLSARGAGGVLGGVVLGFLTPRIAPVKLLSAGLLLTGLLLIGVVNWPVLPVALPLLVLIGIPAMAWLITTETLLQRRTADRFRGRVFGAYGTTTALAMLVGMGAAGLLADRIGVAATLNLSALVLLAAAGLSAFLLPRGAAAPDRTRAPASE